MSLKNNRAPLLCCFKIYASFHNHRWIQTKVTVRKRSIRRFFVPYDLEIWWMTLKNNRAPLQCYFKLCASFRSHWCIRTWVKSPETANLGQIRRFFQPCDLEIWRMTLKNNRAPLLGNIKLYATFHHHMWIQTGVTVPKRSSWVVTSVTLTFDLWPWPFAWTLLWSLVITPENFMMIRWWEHSQRGVTDRLTDGNPICRAAWSQLKTLSGELCSALEPMTDSIYAVLYHKKVPLSGFCVPTNQWCKSKLIQAIGWLCATSASHFLNQLQ